MPTEQLYHRVPRPTASMEKVACFNQKIEDIVRRDGVGSFLKNASQDMLPTMIQEHREYASVLRRFVLTHGAKDPGVVSFLDDQNRPVVQYVRDLGARAAILTLDAQPAVHTLDHPDHLNVPFLSVVSDLGKIHEQRVLTQRYDYLARWAELAGWRCAAAEDSLFKTLVDQALAGLSDQVISASTDAKFTKDHLADLTRKIKVNNLVPTCFFMTETRFADFYDNFGMDEFDDVTQREVLTTGQYQSIWGIPIITAPNSERPEERVWKDNEIYCFASPQDVGRMPVLKDVEITTADQVDEKLEFSSFAREYFGLAITKSHAISKLILKA